MVIFTMLKKLEAFQGSFNEVLPVICSLDPSISLKIILHATKSDLSEQIGQIIIPNLEKYLLPRDLWKDFYPFLNNLLVNQKVKLTKEHDISFNILSQPGRLARETNFLGL